MRAKAFTFGLAVIVLLGVIGALQYSANARLRFQFEAAKMSASQTPHHTLGAPAVREDFTHDDSEAARLRAQIYAAETQLETLLNKAAKPADAVSGPPPPSWINSGNAIPIAAVETGLWAQATGNADVLARSLSFDSAGQVELQKLFSALAAEDQQYFATPKRMAAELITQLTDVSLTKESNGGTMLLVEKSSGADAAEVVMRMTVPEKNFTKDMKTLQLRRETDGWKVIVPASEVNALKNALVVSGQAIPPSQRALRGKGL